jgi:hypothetical protein
MKINDFEEMKNIIKFKKEYILLYLLCCLVQNVSAQKSARPKLERSPQQRIEYTDKVYVPSIHSVQVYPHDRETDFPILVIGSTEKFHVQFDDLRADIRSFYFSIEFCNAQWQPTTLSSLEYASGLNEDRIQVIKTSSNTLQAYTHYQFQFPNERVNPKIPGNYLLKVYESADKRRLIFTKRIYFYPSKLQIEANLVPNPNINTYNQGQKLEVVVHGVAQSNVDPYRDIRLVVFQNQRQDRQMEVRQPQLLRDQQWIFNATTTLLFPGGSEFRYLDLRSFQLLSQQIKELTRDTSWQIRLHDDRPLKGRYAQTPDHDGRFYLLQNDKPLDPMASDYAAVQFQLIDNNLPKDKSVYVVGGFNDFQRTDLNKMLYDPASQRWKLTTLMKQGVYDYTYVAASSDKSDDVVSIDDDFRETDNSYQILLYLRRPGTTWDELWGYTTIQTSKQGTFNR